MWNVSYFVLRHFWLDSVFNHALESSGLFFQHQKGAKREKNIPGRSLLSLSLYRCLGTV
jgi:hypothetical protein